MRKRIIIDANSTGTMMYWTDRFSIFLHMVRKKFGFDIAPADTFDSFKRVTAGQDLIFAFACEQRPRRHMEGLITLKKGIKLILYMHDVHWAKIKRDEGTTKLLKRADLVMVPYYSYFKKVWPQFLDKTVFFPHFFAPHDRYCNLEYNTNPKMKCLLTGNIKSDRYPIRWVVNRRAKNDDGMRGMIDILRHPRHSETQYWTRKNGGVKEVYARTLNEYYCSVADSSMWHLLLTKYFEIPAAGVLLLADEPEDGRETGLVPGKHYVLVTKENVINRIKDCLVYPEKYETIRTEGMRFARANHSANNRLEQFGKILARVI